MSVITNAQRAKTIKTEGLHNVADVRRLYLEVSNKQKGEERSSKFGVTRSWIYRFKSPVTGATRSMGLGSALDIGLAKAKELARAAAEKLVEGKDPIIERDRGRDAVRQAHLREQAARVTFADVGAMYLDKELPRFDNDKHRKQWRDTIALASKAFGGMAVKDIDTDTILAFLRPLWKKTPSTAARIRGRIEKVLDAAKAAGLRQGENPAAWSGHLQHLLTAIPKPDHHAAMPFADVPAFMERLRQEDTGSARALELLILTATRSNETLGARWEEFDLDGCTWTIPASRMKKRKAHTVPLSDRALAILEAVPRIGDFVFAGKIDGEPLNENAMMRFFKRLDGNGYRVHGFRSSFRDWAGEQTNFDREVIEHALAHQLPDETERSYRRGTALEKRRKLMQAWSDYCASVPAVDSDNVVSIRGTA
jgi:integrase